MNRILLTLFSILIFGAVLAQKPAKVQQLDIPVKKVGVKADSITKSKSLKDSSLKDAKKINSDTSNRKVISPIKKETPEMADVLRSNGKIYTVVAVCLTILFGLFIYVFSIDRKISRLEKDQKQS